MTLLNEKPSWEWKKLIEAIRTDRTIINLWSRKKKGTVSQCLLTWVYLPEYLLVIWHLAELLLTKRLPILGWVLFSKPNTTKTKLSCLLGELQCERVGPLHDLKLKMKPENHAFQLTWNTAENKNKHLLVFKSLNFTYYQWISRTAEATQKEILTPGKPRRLMLQVAIKPGLKQHTSSENFTEGLPVTLKCQSPALISLQSPTCAYLSAHSSPRRWLIENSNLFCPKQNSWFSTYLTTLPPTTSSPYL